jgi:hypothetical protein
LSTNPLSNDAQLIPPGTGFAFVSGATGKRTPLSHRRQLV